MDIDKIISHLEGRITEAEFSQRVQKKIEEFGGLLTREGATLIVASELGIPIETEISGPSDISSLTEGMTAVNVIGVVSDVFPLREFSRNNLPGKVANLTLQDMTGSIRTVLWNEDAEKIKDIKRGDVLEILGGYVKKGLYGTELHAGRRGRILVNPETEKEFPSIENKTRKIYELTQESNVNVVGVVARLFGLREFKKENNSGRVSSFVLRDETGEMRISLWGDKAELSENLKVGDVVKIEDAYTKHGLTGLELHVGARGTVSLSDQKISVSLEEDFSTSIPRTSSVNVSGVIVEIGEVRVFERADGSRGKVGSILIKENEDEKRLILWNEQCDVVPFLLVGEPIEVENAYIREVSGAAEIHVGSAGHIRFRVMAQEKKISSLSGICEIEGRVMSEEPLLICDETDSCKVVAEGEFKKGELLRISGEYRENKLYARGVEKSGTVFPSLENIQNPPCKPIAQCEDGDFVIISGFLKKMLKGEDCFRYIIDDGEEEIYGVGFEDIVVGKEYVLRCTIKKKAIKEFIAHGIKEVSDTEACERLIERIGEMIEV